MHASPASVLSLELQELLDEVAAAWELDRDYRVAVHLAATHPDAADEIYAFLDRLVDTATAPTPSTDEREEVASGMRETIEKHVGNCVGKGAASRHANPDLAGRVCPDPDAFTEPLIDYVVEATGMRPSQIAECLGVSVSFLDDVNTYRSIVPSPVYARIVDLAESRLGLDRGRTESSLQIDPRMRMAACRTADYTGQPKTFDDILLRSGMNHEQLQCWLHNGLYQK